MQTIQSDFDIKTETENTRTLLLHGYGASIRIKNRKLVIQNGSHPLYPESKGEKLVISDHANFDRVIIQGSWGWISFPALQWLASWGISVIMLDDLGRLYCNINQIKGDAEVLIRQKQYEAFGNKEKRLQLQKWGISHKIAWQILLFREFGLDSTVMENLYSKLQSATTEIRIENLESSISNAFYARIAKALHPGLGFERRNNPMTRTPRDATDIINALLNYGYTILKTEIAKHLNTIGFDCYIGFMHHKHEGHLSLVYDMAEPFRHLVVKSVLAIANTITENDYYFQYGNPNYPFKSGSPFFYKNIMISNALKKRYVALLMTVFQSKRYQKATIGRKTEQGFQKKSESSIMKERCFELRDFILERKKTLSEAPEILSR